MNVKYLSSLRDPGGSLFAEMLTLTVQNRLYLWMLAAEAVYSDMNRHLICNSSGFALLFIQFFTLQIIQTNMCMQKIRQSSHDVRVKLLLNGSCMPKIVQQPFIYLLTLERT